MPTGIYERTEAHKEKSRQQLVKARVELEKKRFGTGGYIAKHKWVQKCKGKASKCTSKNCSGNSKTYHWALIKDREYSHNPDDYIELCCSCHGKYDMTDEKRKHLKRLADNQKNTKFNRAVLTKEDVIDIRIRTDNGESQKQIANEYGVHRTTINYIYIGEKHGKMCKF